MRILLAAFNKRIAEELNARIANNWRLPAAPSDQQAAIFDAILGGRDDLVVRARAGTGKTSTIVEAVQRVPNAEVVAKTLHAIGFGCVRRFWSDVRVGSGSDRANDLAARVCGQLAPDVIKGLVAKLHTKGREIAPHASKIGDLTDLLYDFECDPDEGWAADGYDVAYVERKALDALALAANEKPAWTGIDFADMIFLPVRNRWLRPAYEMVVVDEAQDMTVAQLEIARGVCKRSADGGRLVVVGDDRQAIYAFRGADSNSLDRLKDELNARELGLTTTYRCGRAIVDVAARLVPDLMAGPHNPAGAVENLPSTKLTETVAVGDFVLSRLNAPLVSVAMSLLRRGVRTRVAGRDVGAGLRALIRRLMRGRGATVPGLLAKLAAWEDREAARYVAAGRPQRVDVVRDQAEMIRELAQEALSVTDLEARIDALFADDGLGAANVVTCSSVHRAKGLEADRVFVLDDTFYPRGITQEEANIEYVAVTRAKRVLYRVSEKHVVDAPPAAVATRDIEPWEGSGTTAPS